MASVMRLRKEIISKIVIEEPGNCRKINPVLQRCDAQSEEEQIENSLEEIFIRFLTHRGFPSGNKNKVFWEETFESGDWPPVLKSYEVAYLNQLLRIWISQESNIVKFINKLFTWMATIHCGACQSYIISFMDMEKYIQKLENLGFRIHMIRNKMNLLVEMELDGHIYHFCLQFFNEQFLILGNGRKHLFQCKWK